MTDRRSVGAAAPHVAKAARRGDPLTPTRWLKISRARQKPNSLLFFARIFRIVEPTNNQGKA
ncbi:hypothetical protein [Rhizobium leguminosarum]|uniref:hypothetical protein n=1 Tax=Rhizobium leguminosarum TaxID=384 RepID=UPI001030E7FF|nr:hypothetical protein [Rhizobium leguminosarum]TAY69249.1 hypothetical protein ELH82_25175 [Rhizobium leguminosarum]